MNKPNCIYLDNHALIKYLIHLWTRQPWKIECLMDECLATRKPFLTISKPYNRPQDGGGSWPVRAQQIYIHKTLFSERTLGLYFGNWKTFLFPCILSDPASSTTQVSVDILRDKMPSSGFLALSQTAGPTGWQHLNRRWRLHDLWMSFGTTTSRSSLSFKLHGHGTFISIPFHAAFWIVFEDGEWPHYWSCRRRNYLLQKVIAHTASRWTF